MFFYAPLALAALAATAETEDLACCRCWWWPSIEKLALKTTKRNAVDFSNVDLEPWSWRKIDGFRWSCAFKVYSTIFHACGPGGLAGGPVLAEVCWCHCHEFTWKSRQRCRNNTPSLLEVELELPLLQWKYYLQLAFTANGETLAASLFLLPSSPSFLPSFPEAALAPNGP